MSSPGVILGKAVGSTLATVVAAAGAWTIAQAGNLGEWPELVGGGVVLTAGLLSLRMVLRASKHERESAAEIEKRLRVELERTEGRALELEAELRFERQRAAKLLIAFDRERNLRVALERAGLTDRREAAIGGDDVISPEEIADLTGELEVELEGPIAEALTEMPEDDTEDL